MSSESKTTPPRNEIAPSPEKLVEWLDWYQSNIIKPSSDRHWIGQCRQFIQEVIDGRRI